MEKKIMANPDNPLEKMATEAFKALEESRYKAEEYECAMMKLDDLGVPREDCNHETYSIVGRIMELLDRANKTELYISVGKKFNYFDTPDSMPYPCEIVRIINNGYYVVYEFMPIGGNSVGSTIYPKKFKPLS